MKTPLAWLNLTHHKPRTAVAAAGIAFAVLLVFMQLGFYGAAESTATVVYDELDFDLLLVSARYLEINRAGAFPRERLYQAQGVPGVAGAVPVYVGFGPWRNPETSGPYAGMPQHIMMIGFRPDERVFRPGGKGLLDVVEGARDELQRPGSVLIDSRSRAEFGPQFAGLVTEVAGRRVGVAGQFTLGTGFGANGLLLVGDATFFLLNPTFPADHVSLGLLRLEPGADAQEVAARLGRALPPDVLAVGRAEVMERERWHWVGTTSVGTIFTLGVVVAFLVGVVFVYQVIASDIANRLHEYATLKALGYGGGYLSGVVLRQALLVALLGYGPGFVAALGLYDWARRGAGIPIGMNAGRALFVLSLTLLMCSLSGLLALRKVRAADPADLF